MVYATLFLCKRNACTKILQVTTVKESIQGCRLHNIPIPLPPLPEQKKIALILSAWDKMIDSITRLIEGKKSLKKGLMQKLFSQEWRFVDEEGEMFPAWESTTLGEIAQLKKGKRYSEERYR